MGDTWGGSSGTLAAGLPWLQLHLQLPQPLPVRWTVLMMQLMIRFSVCLKGQRGNEEIKDFKQTVGRGSSVGTQRLVLDSRLKPFPHSSLAEGGRSTCLLHIQSGFAALKAWHLLKLLLYLKLSSLYWFSKIFSFPSQRARHFWVFKKFAKLTHLAHEKHFQVNWGCSNSKAAVGFLTRCWCCRSSESLLLGLQSRLPAFWAPAWWHHYSAWL